VGTIGDGHGDSLLLLLFGDGADADRSGSFRLTLPVSSSSRDSLLDLRWRC
jgi:hypothetical protein